MKLEKFREGEGFPKFDSRIKKLSRILIFPRLQNKFIGNSSISRNFRKVSKSLWLNQKNGFVFVDHIWHYKALNQYFMAQVIWFRRLTDFKTNLEETTI